MILGAAVCPAAPFLVPGLAVQLAGRHRDVAEACRRALAPLRQADVLLVLAPAPAPAAGAGAGGIDGGIAVRPPGSPVFGSAFGRGDLPPVPDRFLPGAPPMPRAPAVGLAGVVGAHLLAGAELNQPTTVLEVADTSDTEAAVAQAAAALGGNALGGNALGGNESAAARVGVLVLADGAACHGPNAPGAEDDRSAGFDQAFLAALITGDPAALESWDAENAELARLLGARCLAPLRTFTALLRTHEGSAAAARVTVEYSGAPLGVGYLVAGWNPVRTSR